MMKKDYNMLKGFYNTDERCNMKDKDYNRQTSSTT